MASIRVLYIGAVLIEIIRIWGILYSSKYSKGPEGIVLVIL